MLERLQQLADEKEDFAFETTLASKTFAHWLKKLKTEGYVFHLFYLWLPSPELAIARVSERVRMGGHNVPEETIFRRYHAGLTNFYRLYRPIADTWRIYDNSQSGAPRLISSGEYDTIERAVDVTLWKTLKREYHG